MELIEFVMQSATVLESYWQVPQTQGASTIAIHLLKFIDGFLQVHMSIVWVV